MTLMMKLQRLKFYYNEDSISDVNITFFSCSWQLLQNSSAIQAICHIAESRPHLFTRLAYSLEEAVVFNERR